MTVDLCIVERFSELSKEQRRCWRPRTSLKPGNGGKMRSWGFLIPAEKMVECKTIVEKTGGEFPSNIFYEELWRTLELWSESIEPCRGYCKKTKILRVN